MITKHAYIHTITGMLSSINCILIIMYDKSANYTEETIIVDFVVHLYTVGYNIIRCAVV